MQITPYYVRLAKSLNYEVIEDNPLWRQVVPYWEHEGEASFDGSTENWENNHEMKTPICQHKYDDRVIIRSINVCNAYCQFCFEALRTIGTESSKSSGDDAAYEATYEYIRNAKGVREVIFSGGDPLMMSDARLAERIKRVRAISDELLIRIHTRSLSFNPFRVTDDLLETMREGRVNAFGLHIAHPEEISPEFVEAVRRVQSVVPIVFANMPLLKGINNSEDTLRALFMKLYKIGVKPYYIYHFMPHSPGASEYRSSIKEAIGILSRLKRRVSNIAMPEYALPHIDGKFTVPLQALTEQGPEFVCDSDRLYYTFTNWQGDRCRWYDGQAVSGE